VRNRKLIVVAGLVALAGVLRFATIDVQSYWYDEALTATLLRAPFGHMISELPRAELTPPLYYVLAWVWTRAFGSFEIGLRSFSAVAGVATIPVAYLVGRDLVGRRVGITLAALTACNPLLVWYSQEARPYALWVLLAALSFLFFVRSLRRRTERDLWLWSLASTLAVLTHYFAAFSVVPEGVWLAWCWQPRVRALLAGGLVAAVGVALLPLAVVETHHIPTSYIELVSLRRRLIAVPEDFVTGFLVTYKTGRERLLDVIGLALAAAGAALAVWRSEADERRGAAIAVAIAFAAGGVPAILSIPGFDLLDTRNVLIAWLPVMGVVAIGFGARRVSPLVALFGVSLLCVIGIMATAHIEADPTLHRSDLRGSAHALGPSRLARVLAVPVVVGRVGYSLYLGPLEPLGERGVVVSEFDALTPRNPRLQGPTGARPASLPPPPYGFRLVQRTYASSYTLLRYRAARPTRLTPTAVAASVRGLMPGPDVVLERPSGAYATYTRSS